MRYDEGYKLHVGALSSEYVETGMSDTTFNSILSDVYTEVCDAVKENLKQHRQSCMDLGYHRRKRGVHHVLRVLHRRRRRNDHARGPGDTSFSWHPHSF